MTEHPDTITVAKCHPFRGDNFYITLPGSARSGVEYIRADVVAAKNKAHEKEIAVWSENYAALERQLSDHKLAVAMVVQKAAEVCSDLAIGYAKHKGVPGALSDAEKDILALADTDPMAEVQALLQPKAAP